jgi:hypothetical protein
MAYQYAWSWNTAAAIGAGVSLYWLLRYLLKRRYINEYESLRKDAEALELQPPRFWESGVINRKSYSYEKALNWWLWSFQFLHSEALGLKVLCIAVQVCTLVAGYFVLTEPIYFESSQ